MPQNIDYKRIGSSVANGEIRYLSVSQITTFDPSQLGGCHRAWWFDKIKKVKRPQTQAQDTGVEIHRQIEHYLLTGEDTLGIIARAGLRFIPKPGPGLRVEEPFGDERIVDLFDRVRINGPPKTPDAVKPYIEGLMFGDSIDQYLIVENIPILGAIDVINECEHWIDDAGHYHDFPDGIEVLDWKTSSDIEKYAKSGADLIETVQMIGYAKYASQRFPSASRFRLSHGYFQTRGAPRARKVSVEVPLDIVESRWHSVGSIVRQMKDVARETDVEKIEANLNSCGAYRGCFYASQCPRSPKNAVLAAFGVKADMGLLSQIKSGASIAPPAAAPAKPPAPAANNAAVEAEIARLKAEEAAAKNPGTPPASERGNCPADNVPLTRDNSSQLPSGKVVHIGCGVLPPDAPASVPPTNAKPIEPEVVATLPPVVQEAVKAQSAHASPAPSEAPAQEPKRRGRPPKSAAASSKAQEVDQNDYASVLDAAAADPFAGTVLFVDCISSRPLQSLEPYIQERCKELADQFGAADIRCAPADSPLGFGKWKGALTASIRATPPEPGHYSVMFVRESEVKQVAVEALTPLCSVVVRGV